MDAQNACTWVENRGVNLKNQLQELENLTREEKIELIDYLTRQIKTEPKNLVELFQNSPLVGLDIDLERQRDIDNREVELL